MSRALLRSLLELRSSISARPPPTFLLPTRAKYFNQTAHIIEPGTQPDGSSLDVQQEPRSAATQTAQQATASPPSTTIPTLRTSLPPPGPLHASTLSASVRTLLPALAAQPAHYISAHIHGKPYLVTAGDQVRLPFRMPGVLPGDVLRLNRASVLGSRDYTLKAAEGSWVDERLFECRAVVLGTEAEPMRVMIKKKQRNRHKKHVRSKHKYTVLRVSELRINDVEGLES